MTDIEANVFNEGLGISCNKNVDIPEQMEVDSFEPIQKTTGNDILAVNADQEHFHNVEKLVDSIPNYSNASIEPSEEIRVQKKRQTLLDSDSEDEQTKTTTNDRKNEEGKSSHGKVQKKRFTLLDSDSENESNIISNVINEHSNLKPAEDSEKENVTPRINCTEKKKSRLVRVYDSDSDDNLERTARIIAADDALREVEITLDNEQNARLRMLCDSESSADEAGQNNEYQETYKETAYEKNLKVKIKPKKSKKNDESDEKKMTGKEALEQRRQIKSESQRMLRESRVSLPYHRPKSYTLQEFLQRRSRIDDVIKAPPNTPTTFAIKMSSEQLAFTAKRLTEREKEIEEFYKSDTDSEEENDDTENKTDSEKQATKQNENVTSDETNKAEESKDDTQSANHLKSTEGNSDSGTDNSNNKGNTVEDKNDDTDIFDESADIDQLQKLIKSNQLNCELPKENDLENQGNSEATITEEINSEQEELSSQKISDQMQDAKGTSEKDNVTHFEEDEDDEATEVKIKELYSVLEKYISNGTDSSVKTNTINEHQNSKDESTKENNVDNENTSTETTSTIIKQNNNSKVGKELSDEQKAAESKLEQKLNKLNPLLTLKANFQPRLRGGPNDLVVLDEGLEKSKGVNNLMQRFLAHTTKKTVHKKTEVSIVNVQNGIIQQETINLVPNEEEEEPAKKMQTPGAKLKKLREELEEQMAKKRIEEWKKRQEEKKLDNEEDGVYTGEKTDCGLTEPAVLDDEEEEEMTESESSEEEEEEEDEVEIRQKPRIKSAFVDDEAEQSHDLEDEALDDEDDEAEDENDEESDNIEEQNDESKEQSIKKPLKRIISTFNDDDSDDDTNQAESGSALQRTTSASTATDMFAHEETNKNTDCWDDNDDEIPLYQSRRDSLEKTPNRNISQNQNKPDLSFLTPTVHLTGLQGMPSASKLMCHESPVINLSLPPEPSPLRSYTNLKTKLFGDAESTEFDSNLDELEGLCSGKFTGNKHLTTEEAELLGMCSGRFTGLTHATSAESEAKSIEDKLKRNLLNIDLFDCTSDEMKLTFDDEEIMKASKTQVSLSNDKLTYETEANIEARLTEDICTVKNAEETIGSTQTQLSLKPTLPKEISSRPRFVIASSSDEELKEEISSPKKKKLTKKRKRYIIDDISITDEDDFEDREEDFEETEDLDEITETNDTRNINYDSEENEIELDEAGEDNVVAMKKAREFFDAEAELSGSDWGSADEDEKDLDDFEVEEGDMEKINEKKMQQELGRMHAIQVLDDDKREVRLLQELLLDDGELHGVGREKKFRWKNADSMTWNTEDKPKDEDEDCEEIESELQWRKMRHDREMFLKEQQLKKSNVEEDENLLTNDSQIMKLGHAALRKCISGVQSQQKTPEVLSQSPGVQLPFALVNKRGSFLARSETTLARLAQITRTTTGVLSNGPKNSRNFVFTSVDKTDMLFAENTKKRKADEGTPKVLKKLRIADMSPGVPKLKKKLPQKLNL